MQNIFDQHHEDKQIVRVIELIDFFQHEVLKISSRRIFLHCISSNNVNLNDILKESRNKKTSFFSGPATKKKKLFLKL